MDATETGAGGTEAGTAGQETVGPPPAGGPAANGNAKKGRDGMLIALIVVSCVALVLLGSTITLALVGDFGGGGGLRLQRPGLQDLGQPEGPGVERWRELREERLDEMRDRVKERVRGRTPEEKTDKEQPDETPPEGSEPETRAAPGA